MCLSHCHLPWFESSEGPLGDRLQVSLFSVSFEIVLVASVFFFSWGGEGAGSKSDSIIGQNHQYGCCCQNFCGILKQRLTVVFIVFEG